ncbi:infC [Symbiodinium sp. CCMP2592]|nr:infC [Symbiodinium sp. CCMP2592]
MEEANEIMSLRDALEIARSKGVDVILINEEPDPPLVKIFSIGKYVYAEKRKAKELAKNKVPKIKEVKITYTIGDHDLNTKLRNIERWLENKKQQVKVQCVMKGRTRMFEGQARELMERVRREVAHFAKVAGADKGNPTVTKDGRGDLIMMLNAGPDTAILKQLVEEAGGKKALKRQAEEDEDEDEEEEEEEEEEAEETSDEIKAIEAEIKDMREELIDCGISPGQVNTEPEMQDLFKRLDQAKSKLAAAAMASLSPRRQQVAFTASAHALLNSPTLRLR